jgi:diguanylate cyclase (GGDEF)-like protein
MKYTGRIGLVTVAIIISLSLRIYAVYHYSFPPYQVPYTGIVILLVFWKLGEQYDKVKFFSEKDVLTKLNNRRFMIHTFPKLITTANRAQKRLILYFIDVDNFKTINDTHGHDFGDQVLQHIAKVLMFHSRKVDMVVRWAGDEFLIFSPFSDELSKETMINNIKNELQLTSNEVNMAISVSIGTATYPNNAQKLDDLIHEADLNMYKHKVHKNELIHA